MAKKSSNKPKSNAQAKPNSKKKKEPSKKGGLPKYTEFKRVVRPVAVRIEETGTGFQPRNRKERRCLQRGKIIISKKDLLKLCLIFLLLLFSVFLFFPWFLLFGSQENVFLKSQSICYNFVHQATMGVYLYYYIPLWDQYIAPFFVYTCSKVDSIVTSVGDSSWEVLTFATNKIIPITGKSLLSTCRSACQSAASLLYKTQDATTPYLRKCLMLISRSLSPFDLNRVLF